MVVNEDNSFRYFKSGLRSLIGRQIVGAEQLPITAPPRSCPDKWRREGPIARGTSELVTIRIAKIASLDSFARWQEFDTGTLYFRAPCLCGTLLHLTG
jgi:hypothetical protein